MNKDIKAVILAAGKGTRMKSNTPKVLHEIFGKPLLGYVLDNVKTLANEAFVIVGHHAEEVTDFVEHNYSSAKTVLQSPQLGTGHAVSMVCPALENFDGQVIILCGDTPLVREETLKEFGAYAWDDKAVGEDRVIKEYDHHMDLIRYFIYTIARRYNRGLI